MDIRGGAVTPVGTLVISLDVELRWGLRDLLAADSPYHRNLVGGRAAVPRILDLFEEFGIEATWAVVGFLFARSRGELEYFRPARAPAYTSRELRAEFEEIGAGEADDPLHYAPSLIAEIQAHPRQEIGTHTFSHYYCREPGQDRGAFEADLASAVAIAKKWGIRLRSIVLPRNQYNPAYDDILIRAGIRCYRGNPWTYKFPSSPVASGLGRGARFLDSHSGLLGSHTTGWDELVQPNGLCNVPASLFLTPSSPRSNWTAGLRLRRIEAAMKEAAVESRIVHLWWHPHNFGAHPDENLRFLRSVLTSFARLRDRHGMQSGSMASVARVARGAGAPLGA